MLPSLSLHPALAVGNWEVTRSLSFILVCRDFCLSCSSIFSSSLVRYSLSHKRHSLELFLFFMLRALWVVSLSPPPPLLSLPLPLILWTFCRCLFYLPMSFPFEVSELLITWQHSLLSLSLSHTCCHLLRVKFECTYHKIWWCNLCAYFMYIYYI